MNRSGLETALLETGFIALFLYGERSRASHFWSNNRNELEELVKDETGTAKAKFLAAVILAANGVRLESEVLAPLYTMALENSSRERRDEWQLNGNVWAYLFEPGHVGFLGEQLLALDDAAIPHLQPLLNNDGIVRFDGSEEATLGNAGQYRVKDFAAFFISTIRDTRFSIAETHAERDRDIEELKNAL